MESVTKLGEVYIKGEVINLNSVSIDLLENQIEKIEAEEKNIKNQIFNILETF